MKMKSIFIVILFFIFQESVKCYTGQTLKPDGANVCSTTTEYEGYVVKQSSYVGYENYMECCGLFCWSKCQKSRPIRKVFTKSVKQIMSKTTYSCCTGWAPVGRECLQAVCSPRCVYGTCQSNNKCKCHPGFSGDRCEKEIDECNIFPPICDHFCQNIPGSYACSCMKGYTKAIPDLRNGSCINVNECQSSTSLCKCSNPSSQCKATCVDNDGGYQCQCSKGYKLIQNKLCVDENECTQGNHGCDHFCYNNKGKYSCGCKYGYLLDPNDKSTCRDINECTLSNGGCEQVCENLPGSYNCQCRAGFKLLYDKRTCQDENECVSKRPCDPTRGICHNTRGSFKCACIDGYQLQQNGVFCEDADECILGTHGCSHTCVNFIGSYECQCPVGLKLSNDKRSCIDVDECKEQSHQCNQVCINEFGGYKCDCQNEYELDTDGKTCVPKPCLPLPTILHGHMTCPSQSIGSNCSYTCHKGYNLIGDAAHTCLEKQKWSGQQTSCKPIDCPPSNPPINGKLILPCNEHYGSRCIVRCNHGYYLHGSGFTECRLRDLRTFWNINDNTCKAVQLCNPNPCNHGGRCYATSRYTYKCDCRNTGYIGSKCSMGIIEFPSFPTIEVGKETSNLVIEARPEKEVVITPIVHNKAIEFIPPVLTITSPARKITFSIKTGSVTGRIRVLFNVSGINAKDFSFPMSVVIRVTPAKYEKLNRVITEDIYLHQCNNRFVSQCKNSKHIEFYSSCAWDGFNTKGHVSIGQSGFRLPFSITGFSVSKENINLDASEYFTPRADVMNVLRQGVQPCDQNTCSVHLNNDEHEYAVKNNLFVKAYIQQVSKLAPWWFNLFMTSSYKGFDSSNFQSLLYKGYVPTQLQACPNLPALPNSTFSIFTSKVPVDIHFMSANFAIEKISTSCVVVDMCSETFYLSLPITRSIDASAVIKKSGFLGTSLLISGISISKGETVSRKCMNVYSKVTNDNVIEEICVDGNIWSKFSLLRMKPIYNVTFEGDATMRFGNVEQFGIDRFDTPYESVGTGKIEFSARLPIVGRFVDIEFSDPKAFIYKKHIGTKQTPNNDDVMKMITTFKKVRFNYETPVLTFHPIDLHLESPFEIDVYYYIVGGSVTGVENQSKLRIQLSLLMGNINGFIMQLSQIKTTSITFNVEKQFLMKLKTTLFSVVSKLRTPQQYKEFYVSLTELQRHANTAKSILEMLAAKIKVEVSPTHAILNRIKQIVILIQNSKLIPTPIKSDIEEKLTGFQMKFHTDICVHRLCFKNCFVKASSKNKHRVYVDCLSKQDQTLTKYMKIDQGVKVFIEMDTLGNQFTINFKANISLFNTISEGDVFIKPDEASYVIKDFSLNRIKFDLRATSSFSEDTTWNSLDFQMTGSCKKDSEFAQLLNNELSSKLKEVATRTEKQISTIQSQLDANRFDNIEQVKINTSKELKAAELNLKVTKYNMDASKVSLKQARLLFQSYQINSYLRDYERQLDHDICKMKQCPKTCVNTQVCELCQTLETVKANTLKCENVQKKVRITSEEEFDSDCQETRKAYKTIYTGNCQGGGDSEETFKGSLPDWGAGIGNTIGGPVGALIGGLAGGFVGQFFHGCENTWTKYEVKEVITVPCKKIRLKTTEQVWQESKCGGFNEAILSKYGKPTECNCITQCVQTQSPICLRENNDCRIRRKIHLDSILSRAGVFNNTATRFFDVEKNVTLTEIVYEKALENLQDRKNKYHRMMTSYSATMDHKQRLEKELWKITKLESTENCLLTKFKQNITLTMQEIKLTRDFRTKLSNVEIFARNEATQHIHPLHLVVDWFDIKEQILDKRLQILKKIYCTNHFAYSASEAVTYDFAKVDVNYMCNRVQRLFKFIEYPMEVLRDSILDASKRIEIIRKDKREINRTLVDMVFNKFPTMIEETEVTALFLSKRIEDLKEKEKLYTSTKLVLFWLQDMEKYSEEASLYENYGFMDSIIKSFDELYSLRKFSGYNQNKFSNLLQSTRNVYQHILTNYKKATGLKDLSLVVRLVLMQTLQMQSNTNFCSQNMVVKLNLSLRTFKVGHSMRLSCNVASVHEIRYSWYKNQNKIPWEHSSSLEVTVTPSTEGSYRCKGETVIRSNVSQEVYVKVYAPPSFIEQPRDIIVIQSETQKIFSMSCNATGVPKPNVGWFYTPFNSNKAVFKYFGDVIQFRVNDSVEAGMYHCKATNAHGVVLSDKMSLNIIKSCIAHQVFILSFDMPREEVTTILNKIFYSESAKKAWSTSTTQKIILSVSHNLESLSRISFKLTDFSIEDSLRCNVSEHKMVQLVSKAKSDMVQLLKNVLKTMSVKTSENSTIAEIRENSRSTLLLEPLEEEFCPRGYALHQSQVKCVECITGYYEEKGKCKPCLKDYYNDRTGATSCKQCPNSMLTEQEGSNTIHKCK